MKYSNNSIKHDLSATAAAVALTFFQAQAFGAPGTLSNAPLYVGTAVDPNIFILSDDSRSMDWDTMTLDVANDSRFTDNQPDGSHVAAAGSVKHHDTDNDGTANCTFASGDRNPGYMYIVNFSTNDLNGDLCNVADDEAWRARNSDFNPIYFDPTKDYKPWGGVDNSGVGYPDADITNAPNDPYNPTEWINLTTNNAARNGGFDRDGDGQLDGFRFYTWTDDGNDIFENGEETEYQIGKVTDGQAAAWGKTASEVKQNFANWFSYHRKREYVAKYAFSTSIDGMTGVRIGYGSINNNNSNNIEIASMNLDPAVGNKRAMLNKLFATNSDNSTPIKQNFEKVGKYFDYVNGSFFGDTGSYTNPIVSSAEGGACQKNFNILMTDGYYNDASFNAAVNNADANTANAYDGGDYADAYVDTLADVAMYYYKTDLDTGLSNDVPPSTTPLLNPDNADHQHMTTYTVAFGVLGTLDINVDPSDAAFAGWTNPSTSNATKIDDLWHAAYNGRGDFFSAQDPQALSAAIESALASASKGTSSAAAVAFNTTTLDTGSVVFQALFNPTEDWKGELTSTELDGDGVIADTPTWNAGDELTPSDSSSRVIWTYRKDTSTGVAFKTYADLSATQKADLDMGPSGADGQGQARIDYLRGSNANESQGLFFRNRTNVLGDIVHSNPVYVGKPQSNHPNVAPFGTALARHSTFETAYENRDGIIYVGANDGMLHGFAEATGEEVMAYVPNTVFSNASGKGLHYLTDPSYSHNYYVDLSPTVADVFLNSSAWKTVLVGGLRAGGRGIFALDVTYRTGPTATNTYTDANAASKVLWEFDSSDNSNLGYTFSKPTIAMMENDKWAVIFGNGYNSDDGEASLFILYIDQGLDGTWSATDYEEIKTGVGTSGTKNGLSTPAVVDTDGNGQADRVYAGDLFGNLWAFDLSATNASQWKVAYKQGSTPKPMFTAQTNQAITSKPIVALQAAEVTGTAGSPNLMVFFGTGQFIVNGDKTTTDSQSFYGIWDEGNKEMTISDLTEQQINESGNIRTTNDPATAIPYDGGNNANKGWYHNLPTSGERVVVNPKIRGQYVFYNTLIPGTELCKPEGYGWLMAVKQSDGAMSDTPIFDVDGDGDIDEDDVQTAGLKMDNIPAGSNFLGDVMYTPDDEGNVDIKKVDTGISEASGRMSWQELYQE